MYGEEANEEEERDTECEERKAGRTNGESLGSEAADEDEEVVEDDDGAK